MRRWWTWALTLTVLAMLVMQVGPIEADARGCEWKTYRVGEDGDQPTLAGALDDAARDSICGAIIYLPSGRHEIGLVNLTKSTVIKGEGEATIVVGTIVNESGVPLRLEGLRLAEAPFPGALLVSHPDADTTLNDVTVIGATGFGILQNGGRLEATNTHVEGTRVPGRDDVLPPELEGQFGPAAGTDEQPGRVRFPGRHKLGLRLAAHASGVRESGSGWMTRMQNILSTSGSFKPIQSLGALPCLGTGLLLSGGGYGELSDVSLAFNAGAGVAISGWPTFIGGFSLGTLGNGFAPGGGWIASGGCFGGITVRDDATLVTQGTGSSLNFGVGVLVATGGVSMLFDLLATTPVEEAIPDDCSGCYADLRDNVVVAYGSYLSLNDFQLTQGRVGANFAYDSSGNLANGIVTYNDFGIADGDCQVFVSNVDYSGNGTNYITGLCVPVPDAPVDVPDGPYRRVSRSCALVEHLPGAVGDGGHLDARARDVGEQLVGRRLLAE
jgi:hypothetical protein